MRIRRVVVIAGCTVLGAVGVAAVPARAASPATLSSPPVNLSRPFIPVSGKTPPAGVSAAAAAAGISVSYSGNWSGYAAVPKSKGTTFASVVGNYTVPSVDCAATPNTFSYHWIGLDGWANGTVEQDGIAADCNGHTAQYAAWFEMYPAGFKFDFTVHPGDAIESAVRYLGGKEYELSLQDVSSGRGFDVTKKCPVSACANTSAEAITEAYYYNSRFAGTSAFGDEHYANVTVTDSAGHVGGLTDPNWKTGEGIALGEYGAVDTTPGPVATVGGLSPASAFSVFWSRMN